MENLNLLLRTGLLVCVLLSTGCMQMRLVAEYDSDNPVPRKATRWAFAWGLVQPNDIVDEDCASLCVVETKTNLGYVLISALSLGIAVPMSVEYQCCAFDPGEGDL